MCKILSLQLRCRLFCHGGARLRLRARLVRREVARHELSCVVGKCLLDILAHSEKTQHIDRLTFQRECSDWASGAMGFHPCLEALRHLYHQSSVLCNAPCEIHLPNAFEVFCDCLTYLQHCSHHLCRRERIKYCSSLFLTATGNQRDPCSCTHHSTIQFTWHSVLPDRAQPRNDVYGREAHGRA